LANHFLRYYWNRHKADLGDAPVITEDGVRALQSHAWRGNVRELQNVIEHAVVLLDPGSRVGPSQIPFIGADETAPEATQVQSGELYKEAYHAARDRTIAEFEQRYLKALINRASGNMSKAARLAGVDRTTLYRLMEKHGLQRETIMVNSE
jgi:DNA-binding NtrC family response regulator